ncbi:PREDICTED: protein myomaker isoform X3 [Poecilia mexicana]|uniref:protein myomaker isoform X3 n=1 Tax=Poecilia mexicana TaxID=48701 RepID=UPI00072DCB05|nr:PREDICTED: protein myomaker isoform X3 [Poecilia mexicana]
MAPSCGGRLNFKWPQWTAVRRPTERRGAGQKCSAVKASPPQSDPAMGAFIAKMLLPTASSLVFLPAASVAAKRGFHTEAMVYFFTMFFTAIYHACDGPGLSILCFMRYDILEYFSVYGTALSMWVTLVALGDFDEPQRSTISMFGVLTIAVRIYQDRWGYGIYSGPIGSAVFIITIKWLQKMKQLRAIYPEKSVYTQQEWDYAYVHSFYHLSLAVSFVLLLPKKNRYAGSGENAAKITCLTLCCCTMSPGSSKEKTNKPQKKKSSRSVWRLPTEKLWPRGSGTPTLPVCAPPPSPPVKGTSVSKLKELNGWK